MNSTSNMWCGVNMSYNHNPFLDRATCITEYAEYGYDGFQLFSIILDHFRWFRLDIRDGANLR